MSELSTTLSALEPTLPTVPDIALPAALKTGDVFRRRMLELLASLRGCALTIVEDDGRFTLGHPDEDRVGDAPLRATIFVRDPAMYRAVALGGSIGVGEAYMDGLWDTDDLVSLVRVFVRNRALLDRMETGLARVFGWLMKALHALRPNTRRGSRRNIAAHYDIGNELFALFLDENMMYSSAIFANEDDTLEQASFRKLERICEKLALAPGDRLIEVGSGWGGFALHAASRFGCHVTTATISSEQYDLARMRVAAAGLSDRVEVLLQDYRDLDGRYDKLVSIEMIEAIGAKQLDTYFAKCASLLEPDGMALVQAITIEDHRYQLAVNSVDFIKRFIFPGSFIPAISPMMAAVGRASDLRLFHLEDIGPSYATTLRHWRERFTANLDRVRALGYPDRFIRMWLFYLCYCEGGFRERSIGDVQMLLVKPECRRAAYLPDLQ